MPSLRVLHVGKFYPPYRGGMEVFLADLVTTQRAQGIDAAALVHGTPEADDPAWLVRVPVQFNLLYAPIALGFRAALARTIRRFRPDVLHLHLPNNSALWVLTLPQARAIPWVVHWHSDVVLSNIKWSVAAAYALYRPFEQAVLDGAARIIATSPPYLQASTPLQYWHSKCAVVPLGLNTSALPATPAPCPSTATPFWQPHTRLRLLSIGRLTYYKGFETLITAVQGLPGVELLIAGEGELRAPLQALIHATTRAGTPPAVRLLGEVSEADKHSLLSQCDVFCLASRERTEAFGVVLLEAMHHARPCIVTDLPGSGMPWVVAQAHAGLRVPIEDIAGWQSAITRLQFDDGLRQQLGQAGAQALQHWFGIEACARAVSRQYRGIHPAARHATPRRTPLAVIATHNHAQGIGTLVRQLRAQGLQDVLVIDQRSTDGTCHQAQAAGARVLHPLLPQSHWGAIQTGLRYALAQGHDGAITVDADHPPGADAVARLLQQRTQADVTLAAPTPTAGARLEMRWFRLLSGLALRAPHAGLHHYSRRALSLLTGQEATLLDHAGLGVLLLARRAGLQIAEITVSGTCACTPPARPAAPLHWARQARRFTATTLLCLACWQPRKARARLH